MRLQLVSWVSLGLAAVVLLSLGLARAQPSNQASTLLLEQSPDLVVPEKAGELPPADQKNPRQRAADVLTVWLPIVVLIAMSGLFSGLTLGLLSLDIKQLEILINGGEENERKWAERILPTRRHGNWLLCTLLLGNVAVNALLSILLADMTSGAGLSSRGAHPGPAGTIGFITSTALIVTFGEILPQAFCSRYGLVIGYYTVPVVWVIMAVLSPLAWPISYALDKALGNELGQIYSRNQVAALLGRGQTAGAV